MAMSAIIDSRAFRLRGVRTQIHFLNFFCVSVLAIAEVPGRRGGFPGGSERILAVAASFATETTVGTFGGTLRLASHVHNGHFEREALVSTGPYTFEHVWLSC
jgi:hypothetical protein